jgi:hypothetical protein
MIVGKQYRPHYVAFYNRTKTINKQYVLAQPTVVMQYKVISFLIHEIY